MRNDPFAIVPPPNRGRGGCLKIAAWLVGGGLVLLIGLAVLGNLVGNGAGIPAASRSSGGALVATATPRLQPRPTNTLTFQEYEQRAANVTFEELARNTEQYEGEMVELKGEVIQIVEGRGDQVLMRVNMTEGEYYWDDPVAVHHVNAPGARVLEGDIVHIFAVVDGRLTYETVMGAQATVPELTALSLSVLDRP